MIKPVVQKTAFIFIMAAVMDEDKLFAQECLDDFAPNIDHPLHRNFDFAGNLPWDEDGDCDSDNEADSMATTSTNNNSSNNNNNDNRAATSMEVDIDDSDEDDDEVVDEPDDNFANPTEHLQFVFSELDTERLPQFDWQQTEKVACIPPFQPGKPFGGTKQMANNCSSIDYFSLYYDADLLEKARILLIHLIHFVVK